MFLSEGEERIKLVTSLFTESALLRCSGNTIPCETAEWP